MRWIKNVGLGIAMLALVGSCLREPGYSSNPIPSIKLQSVNLKNGPGGTDTMVFVLTFKDGDGDLGYGETSNGLPETAIYTSATDSTDINSPFYYVYDTVRDQMVGSLHYLNVDLSQYGSNLAYVNYKAKRLNRLNNLPDLSCTYWTYPDTIYQVVNPLFYNFFVDVYIKNSSGGYDLLDPTLINPWGQGCILNLFNSRIPILSSDLGKKSPIDGTLTFHPYSAGYYNIFNHGEIVKFKIHITDRAFNSSNYDSAIYTFP